MEKVIRDGKVGVLISPGYGAGFYTCNAPLEAIFDPTLIGLIEDGEIEKAVEYCDTKWGIYTGGVPDLQVMWIAEGTTFTIDEYDGLEYLRTKDDIEWIIA